MTMIVALVTAFVFFPLLRLFPWQYLACQMLTLPHLVNQLAFESEKMEAAYLSA